MKISKLLLNKRNAVFFFFKIKIHILSYLIVIAFLLVITKAYAMQKTTESKTSLSSGKNMALYVSTVGSGGNYLTLKTAINAVIIIGVMTLQIISNTTQIHTSLNASGSGRANYSSVLIYATGAGYFISSIANPLINFNVANNVAIDRRVNATETIAGLTFTNTNTGLMLVHLS